MGRDESVANGSEGEVRWKFRADERLSSEANISIRGVLSMLMKSSQEVEGEEAGREGVAKSRPTVPLGHGDPSSFPSFRIAAAAEEAVISALRSGEYNCYSPPVGLLPARKAIAQYLSQDLPFKLSSNDVYITNGCGKAIEIVMSVLARPNANILLPRPGFPLYEARAAFCGIQARHYDLLLNRNWEINLDALKSLVDDDTVAMVVINPGNPCGNVFPPAHLAKVAETAKKLGILVIADEVYSHLTFGSVPFVPMGAFSSVVPVLTLGSLSKRWMVPGWRLGWLAVTDPNEVLKHTKVVNSIRNLLNITSEPATFIQAAVPEIIGSNSQEFLRKTLNLLKQTADICYNRIAEICCLTCLNRPEGSMFAMIKLEMGLLEDIKDDMDFCFKLAKEESVIILPGCLVGLKNWIRITFAIEPPCLEDGMARLKAFCQRHVKKTSMQAQQ